MMIKNWGLHSHFSHVFTRDATSSIHKQRYTEAWWKPPGEARTEITVPRRHRVGGLLLQQPYLVFKPKHFHYFKITLDVFLRYSCVRPEEDEVTFVFSFLCYVSITFLWELYLKNEQIRFWSSQCGICTCMWKKYLKTPLQCIPDTLVNWKRRIWVKHISYGVGSELTGRGRRDQTEKEMITVSLSPQVRVSSAVNQKVHSNKHRCCNNTTLFSWPPQLPVILTPGPLHFWSRLQSGTYQNESFPILTSFLYSLSLPILMDH